MNAETILVVGGVRPGTVDKMVNNNTQTQTQKSTYETNKTSENNSGRIHIGVYVDTCLRI